MAKGHRDFRAVAFTSSVRESALLTILADASPPDTWENLRESTKQFVVKRGAYYSDTAYLDNPELLKEFYVPNGPMKYKYDIYLCKWLCESKPVLIVAVPFPKMAIEVFRTVEDSLAATTRTYKTVDLERLVKRLGSNSSFASNVVATAARFRVSGDAGHKVKSVLLSGKDVITSTYYQRSVKGLKGIILIPRWVKLKYTSDTSGFSLETDAHGNFLFHVTADGANLAHLHNLLTALDSEKLLLDTVDYPRRDGLRKEENELFAAST